MGSVGYNLYLFPPSRVIGEVVARVITFNGKGGVSNTTPFRSTMVHHFILTEPRTLGVSFIFTSFSGNIPRQSLPPISIKFPTTKVETLSLGLYSVDYSDNLSFTIIGSKRPSTWS